MTEKNDYNPHCVMFWGRLEIHKKLPNGQISNSPIEMKDIIKFIDSDNLDIAADQIKNLEERIKECLNTFLNADHVERP